MITPEQNKEITQYLISKNLPIDLVLEIKDHMIEQIESMENLTFEEAFEKVKESWKEEFVYKFSFSRLKMITKYEKNITQNIHSKILLNALFCIIPIFIITFIFGIYNKSLYLFLINKVYYFCVVVAFLTLLINYKIQKTTFAAYQKKISIYQKGASNLFVSVCFILIYNILVFDHNKDINTFHKILNLEFSFNIIFELLTIYIYIFWWLLGLFYFLKYRKTIKELQNRINLKL